MKRYYKGLFILIIFVFSLISCQSLPGTGKIIHMGQASWDTGWFQAQVYKLILEEIGYEIAEPITLENPEFYIIAAQGDIDFWVNGWFPIHNRYMQYEGVSDNLEIVGNQVKAGALQGYLIDKNVAEKLGINNLGDFQDPEIAKIFDLDGNGKADLLGCNEGWGCSVTINHHLEEYGLSETVEHIQGNYSDLISDRLLEYQPGSPLLFFTWTPNWTVSEFEIGKDVIWLSVPYSSLPDSSKADTSIENLFGCPNTPCDLGFGASDIRVVVNKTFLLNNLAAGKLFELITIPMEDISNQNVKMFNGENTTDDIREHANEWIKLNRNLVDQWIAESISSGN